MSTGPRPDEVVIGLDVGTTTTKAVAFGRHGWSRGASRPTTFLAGSADHAEQDPEAVVGAGLDALTACVAGLDGIRVAGIALASAMHGLMGLGVDGSPITPLVTWADGRAVAQAARLAASGLGLHEVSGTPMHPMAPVAKLSWFAEHEPSTAATVDRWIDLKAWVLLRLTGVLATDTSSASGTGLLDLATADWHPPALAAADVTADRLPRLVAPTEVLALTPVAAMAVGLPTGTPVVVGAGDGPLANLGMGADVPGVAGLSLGTSGAVRMVVSATPDPVDAGLFRYLLVANRMVIGEAVSTGGLVVDWARTALAPDLATVPAANRSEVGPHRAAAPDIDAHRRGLLALAGSVPPGSDGVVAVPDLVPPRAPRWHPDRAGAWLGVRRHHTRAHLARAAIEGVGRQLADIVDRIDMIQPVEEVRATGGAMRVPIWREVVAGMVARPLVVVDDTAGTARGAAVLGWWALDRTPDLASAGDELASDVDHLVVEPDPDVVAACRASRRRLADLVGVLSTGPSAS